MIKGVAWEISVNILASDSQLIWFRLWKTWLRSQESAEPLQVTQKTTHSGRVPPREQMLPAKGNVIMLAGVPKLLCPPGAVLPRGTMSPSSLLLSLWHSSCTFRRGGCLGLYSFFWWLMRFHQEGKHSQPFTIGLFAAVLLIKHLDIQLLLLEEGEHDSKLREFALGKVGNTIYWHKSLPWCGYSWGCRSLESKLLLFHFCYWCLSGLIMYEITERGAGC